MNNQQAVVITEMRVHGRRLVSIHSDIYFPLYGFDGRFLY